MTAAFELDPQELVVLRLAAATLDELDRITKLLATTPLAITGSAGQVTANPMFREARAHRLLLRDLLKHLGVEAPPVAENVVKLSRWQREHRGELPKPARPRDRLGELSRDRGDHGS